MKKSARLIPQETVVILSLVLMAALALPAVACAPEEQGPVVEVRIHSQMPAGHYVTESIDLFIEEAEARSNGSLNFTHYPSQQLYTDMAIANVLPEGGVEMAQIQGLMFYGRVRELVGALLPGFYEDQDHYFRFCYDVEHGGGLISNVLEPAFEEKANAKLLSFIAYALNTCTLTTKPVYKVEDWAGMKIRTYGKPPSTLLKTAGASPVVMSAADVYMALQRGTIDGAFSGLTSFYSRKWYESAKYVQDFYSGSANFNLAANLDFWNSLAPSQQKAILEAALTAEIYSIERAMEDESQSREALTAAGVEVYDLPPSEFQKLKDLARPALIDMVMGDLGEELGAEVVTMIDDTRDAKTTWRTCCEEHNKRLLAEIE